jgi:uncharacterized membrane protein YgdD (TMEM256/DUF423 family)
MERNWIFTGCMAAALAVVAGAFGAHALQDLLEEKYIHTYQTAVTYHFFHALAVILTGMLHAVAHSKKIKIAYRLFIAGLILFSGSLYTMTLIMAFAHLRFTWLGAITPIGGLSFIAGWVVLGMAARKPQ